MTDDITDYERVRWGLWICPECEGVLEPLGDPKRDEQRNETDWWEEPEQWADIPAMQCNDCERRYRMRFEVEGDEGEDSLRPSDMPDLGREPLPEREDPE